MARCVDCRDHGPQPARWCNVKPPTRPHSTRRTRMNRLLLAVLTVPLAGHSTALLATFLACYATYSFGGGLAAVPAGLILLLALKAAGSPRSRPRPVEQVM